MRVLEPIERVGVVVEVEQMRTKPQQRRLKIWTLDGFGTYLELPYIVHDGKDELHVGATVQEVSFGRCALYDGRVDLLPDIDVRSAGGQGTPILVRLSNLHIAVVGCCFVSNLLGIIDSAPDYLIRHEGKVVIANVLWYNGSWCITEELEISPISYDNYTSTLKPNVWNQLRVRNNARPSPVLGNNTEMKSYNLSSKRPSSENFSAPPSAHANNEKQVSPANPRSNDNQYEQERRVYEDCGAWGRAQQSRPDTQRNGNVGISVGKGRYQDDYDDDGWNEFPSQVSSEKKVAETHNRSYGVNGEKVQQSPCSRRENKRELPITISASVPNEGSSSCYRSQPSNHRKNVEWSDDEDAENLWAAQKVPRPSLLSNLKIPAIVSNRDLKKAVILYEDNQNWFAYGRGATFFFIPKPTFADSRNPNPKNLHVGSYIAFEMDCGFHGCAANKHQYRVPYDVVSPELPFVPMKQTGAGEIMVFDILDIEPKPRMLAPRKPLVTVGRGDLMGPVFDTESVVRNRNHGRVGAWIAAGNARRWEDKDHAKIVEVITAYDTCAFIINAFVNRTDYYVFH